MDKTPLNQLSTDEIKYQHKKAGQVYETLSRFVNGSWGDNEALVELLARQEEEAEGELLTPQEEKAAAVLFTRDHRTLQQSMVRLALQIIERAAEDGYGTDPRNQQSHNVCKKLIEGFKTQNTEDWHKDFPLPSTWLGCI